MPFMYCDPPAAIVQIRPAVDQSRVGAGMIKLKSGATFEISTPDSNDGDFLKHLKKTDHIQLCYAPSQRWADAAPTARMAIVGDVESKAYTYTLAYPAEK